ncbi:MULTISPECIES: signal peptidase I [unclassified Streptomyces]|uniref:signal peptidase I n=1 Tax=unclassified Streptomyces TaxID=2593676 RepID=UPI000DAC6C33|nr:MULTISPECIES: signal peptidase I [unclassified Streptomyces]PZT76973.1 signal peptidase I [Streptomyces sp. AC1-42W]PZT79071.1 signal peptidase I [Streptomyces sp. AC1-42T]
MGSRGRRAAPTAVRGAPSEEDAARSLPTRAERRKLARKVKRRRRRSAVREIPLLITVALLIALFMKTFLVQAFVIPSGSMEQTIRIGDRVLVDKLTPWLGSKPQRGDVVVFRNPSDWPPPNPVGEEDPPPVGVKQLKQLLTFAGLLPSDDEQDLIKRVVAVGGDTVRCCAADGRITVNGVAVDEPYVFPGDSPSTIKFEVKVPPGRLFVMGDHRSNSADSRFHLDRTADGTISEDSVVGRAKWIVWPFGHWAGLAQRSAFSAVPDARAGSAAASGPSNSVSEESNRLIRLPTPAELPLVMGVVGLHRLGRRRWHGIRSGCGGFGGRRTIRTRRTRGPAGQPGAFRAVRRGGGGRDG